MSGMKSLHAGSTAKAGRHTAVAAARRGPQGAGPRARRMIDAIAGFFHAGQQHPAGLYLPLVRIDRDD